MNNISIIMIAHNQKEILISQIKQLCTFHNVALNSIIIVDNYSSDGLNEFLKSQNQINYIICDEKLEGFSTILNTCISEFIDSDNDILILDPNSFLLPGTLYNISNALNPDKGIFAIAPQDINKCHCNINSFADALDYVNNNIQNNVTLSKIIMPENDTILLSHKLFTKDTPFDSKIMSNKLCYTDFFIKNILKDQFTYIATNVYQYYTGNYHSYYDTEHIINNDTYNIRKKWHMNYINTAPSINLVNMINESPDRKLNILEIGCDCGATLLKIKEIYHNANLYGIDINPISANIASHLASVKVANIEDSVEIWNDIKFDYILFGDVLEHHHDPSKVINNCHHILKERGKIISNIPNLMHYSVLHELIDGHFEYTDTGLLDKTHIHFFTCDEIIKMYKNNNFQIIAMNACNLPTSLSEDDTDFINILTKLSSHKNPNLFKAFQYITLAEKKD